MLSQQLLNGLAENDLCLISSRIFFSFWNIEIGKLFSWFSICFWSTYLLNVYSMNFGLLPGIVLSIVFTGILEYN